MSTPVLVFSNFETVETSVRHQTSIVAGCGEGDAAAIVDGS
jgi:hypothetical protein